jgi:DNA integrity scanning protein DisA with diadenylate cyclase activity
MLSDNAGHEYRDAVRDILDFLFRGVVVMDMDMAAHVYERLAKMDAAIELMQDLRKETVELFAELFPGDCQKDLFAFEEEGQ